MSANHLNVIDCLEAEWEELRRRGVLNQALARWRRREPSLDFTSVDEIVALLADRTASGEIHDRVLRPLLRLAADDPLAARLVLFRFLPCLKQMSDWGEPFEVDEWLTLLVACAYEVVTTYPLRRRPRRIAGNIAWDVRKRAYAALRSRRRDTAELTRTGRLRACERDLAAEERLARVEDADELSRRVCTRKDRYPDRVAALVARASTFNRHEELKAIYRCSPRCGCFRGSTEAHRAAHSRRPGRQQPLRRRPAPKSPLRALPRKRRRCRNRP